MRIINIANKGRFIYLFTRDDQGNQKILLDKKFFPFYFEPDRNGAFKSYDGIALKKIICNSPSDIAKQRSPFSYGSDIKYVISYLTNKVDKIEPCPLKIFYLDIEILTPVLPDVYNPIYPISCITIYNTGKDEYKTFFMNDYQGSRKQKEEQLIEDTIKYFKEEKPDLWLSWNVEFDYNYMHNRIANFAQRISPVDFTRGGKGNNIFFPAGISIVDLMGLYKKFTLNKKRYYSLNYIAEEDLDEKAWKDTKFGREEDLDIVKQKNIRDVELLVKLDKKFGVIQYFNEIRIFAKCLWEDLPQEVLKKDGKLIQISNNSKIIDSLILEEAKIKNVVLPKKSYSEKEAYDGAYRESFETGVFQDLAKLDLGSAYPAMIADFCLDTVNITNEADKEAVAITVNDRKTGNKIDTYYYKQNSDAILPSVIKKLMVIKDKLKSELGNTSPDDENFKNLTTKYNAIKSIVNSCYGVTGNSYFRLFDKRIAETITFLVRDLLFYVRDRLKEKNIDIVYADTDSVFIKGKDNICDMLNGFIKDWGLKKYNNPNVSVKFDYEGFFEKILILGLCHYYGYIRGRKGVKREIKGVEIKRSSSSKYEAYFQENLIEKILNKENLSSILAWIKNEKIRIRSLPLNEVGFPAKYNQQVKNYPITLRACDNTKKIAKDFILEQGELFYYVFIRSLGKLNNGKEIDVLAFKSDEQDFVDKNRIDWNKTVERNIEGKADKLFQAMGWKEENRPLVTNILFD